MIFQATQICIGPNKNNQSIQNGIDQIVQIEKKSNFLKLIEPIEFIGFCR